MTSMLDWIIREWRERQLGVLIVGGQVMVAGGLREETKDVDACLAAKQCPRMLAWIAEKEAQRHAVELRTGSAPLHPDWLSRGWTCHVTVDDERLDFFGVPLRSPRRIVERFLGDPAEVTLASLVDLGYLKRTERPKDWADIELIASRLRAEGDGDAMLSHLFGEALVAELVENREREAFRVAVRNSPEARQRPILELGLTAPLDDLHAMARAEQFFWMTAGARRSQEIVQTLRRFWQKHHQAVRGGASFGAQHERLLRAAREDLPLSPVRDPTGLIDAARAETGIDRWPGLLPATPELVSQYFPAYGPVLKTLSHLRMSQKPDATLPISARMSPAERAEFARSLEIGWREFLGPERFDAYQKRIPVPGWLAELPQLPPRNPDGSLPALG